MFEPVPSEVIPLRHMELLALRMAQPVEPCFFAESHGLQNKRGVPLPMANGIAHPGGVWIRGKRPAIGVNAANRVVVFKNHEHEFGSLRKLKRVGMKIDARRARWIARQAQQFEERARLAEVAG